MTRKQIISITYAVLPWVKKAEIQLLSVIPLIGASNGIRLFFVSIFFIYGNLLGDYE